jgi:hypothetical protein
MKKRIKNREMETKKRRSNSNIENRQTKKGKQKKKPKGTENRLGRYFQESNRELDEIRFK